MIRKYYHHIKFVGRGKYGKDFDCYRYLSKTEIKNKTTENSKIEILKDTRVNIDESTHKLQTKLFFNSDNEKASFLRETFIKYDLLDVLCTFSGITFIFSKVIITIKDSEYNDLSCIECR